LAVNRSSVANFKIEANRSKLSNRTVGLTRMHRATGSARPAKPNGQRAGGWR
jgi:hypothetical protein